MSLPAEIRAFEYLTGASSPVKQALMRALYQRRTEHLTMYASEPELLEAVQRNAPDVSVATVRACLAQLMETGVVASRHSEREVRTAREWMEKPVEFRLTPTGAEIEALVQRLSAQLRVDLIGANEFEALIGAINTLEKVSYSDPALASLLARGAAHPSGIDPTDEEQIEAFRTLRLQFTRIEHGVSSFLTILEQNKTAMAVALLERPELQQALKQYIANFGVKAQKVEAEIRSRGRAWEPGSDRVVRFAHFLGCALAAKYPSPDGQRTAADEANEVAAWLSRFHHEGSAVDFFRQMHRVTTDAITRLFGGLLNAMDRSAGTAARTRLLEAADAVAGLLVNPDLPQGDAAQAASSLTVRTLGPLTLRRWAAPGIAAASPTVAAWAHEVPLITFAKRQRGRPAEISVGARTDAQAERERLAAAEAATLRAQRAAMHAFLARPPLIAGGTLSLPEAEFRAYERLLSLTLQSRGRATSLASRHMVEGYTEIGRVEIDVPAADEAPATIHVEGVGVAYVPAMRFRATAPRTTRSDSTLRPDEAPRSAPAVA